LTSGRKSKRKRGAEGVKAADSRKNSEKPYTTGEKIPIYRGGGNHRRGGKIKNTTNGREGKEHMEKIFFPKGHFPLGGKKESLVLVSNQRESE